MRSLQLVIALAFFLALAVSGVFAQIGYNDEGAGLEIRLRNINWYTMMAASILTIVMVNALFYAIGHAFMLDSVKRYAESELLQVTVSTLLIVFSVALVMQLTAFATSAYENVVQKNSCSIPSDMFWSFGYNAMTATAPDDPLAYVSCNVEAKILALENLYNTVYKSNLGVEKAAYSCEYLFGMQIYCGYFDLHQQVETAHLYAAKIVPLLTLLQTERALVNYLRENMLPIFMSLGLVMRILPLTRGIGGLMMAIALGFYFVFPLVYVITDPTVLNDIAYYDQPLPGAGLSQCYDTFSGSVSLVSMSQMATGSIGSLFGDIGGMLAELTVGIIFYPFVALSVTIVFINTVAPILGGDAGEIARAVSKMI
ncbi:hypothetical protein COX84_05760 [Candidatus Micrarchaeota archaeon CG_4_10_14_0_2_um_filter_49_7]|nr:MAG: hypothetical protein AUJ13_05405 [Candidatus Micrarchaeota archaeon CG1_02_49_24]PIU82573.1 MAG: hypothetical protein COS70_00615 [Candidatus Micrarchaeota archaeon CG06_land_8_20_14_3_00_50_6]PIZ93683.1 MAG: hypothetical protein COX84_05760 [Candidatus Micrarchaeota archaeon CG_4_10_14_0_2_um_filter_49_7]